jgi:hypothetical protein
MLTKPHKGQDYQFYGDPAGVAAAAQAHSADRQSQAQMHGNSTALAGILAQQPGVFGGHMVNLTNAYGQNAAGMLGNFTQPYAQGLGSYMGGLGSLGTGLTNMFGSAAGSLGNAATAGVGALGQAGAAQQSAMGGVSQSGNQALADVVRSTTQGQAARDQSVGNLGQAAAGRDANAYGALAGLGGSANSALGGLGAAQQASLANQAIAAANAYGQMANGMYNMHGQLGNSQAAVAAAEAAAMGNAAAAQQAAGPQYAKLQFLSQAMPEVLNTMRYGFQTMPYGVGQMNLGGGSGLPAGAGGFEASGPEGMIAAGSFMAPSWSSGGGGSSGGFTPPPTPATAGALQSLSMERPGLPDFTQGSQSMRSALDALLANSNQQSDALRGDLGSQFAALRGAGDTTSLVNSILQNTRAGSSDIRSAGQDFAAGDQRFLDTLMSSNYDPSAGFAQINQNTQAGLGQLGSSLGGLTGNINSVINNTASAMDPMLQQGASSAMGLAGQMGNQFGSFANNIGNAYGGAIGGLNDRFDQTSSGLGDMFNNTIGRTPMFQSPADRVRAQREAQDLRGQHSVQDRIASAQRVLADPGPVARPGMHPTELQALALNQKSHAERQERARQELARLGAA